MKTFLTLIIILLSFGAKAQSEILDRMALTTGYHYKGRNTFYAGLSYSNIESDKNHQIIASVGASAFRYAEKWKIAPEMSILYGNLAMFGAVVSTKHIEPQVGLSIFNLMTFHFGYAFPFDEKFFKGFTAGLRINIALTKYDDFYVKLK